MPKITPRSESNSISVKTKTLARANKAQAWWNAPNKKEMFNQLLSTATFLKDQQQYRYRQASHYARLYSNYPLYGWAGISLAKMNLGQQLPSDRPTFNVIQACIDTKVSRITQSKPRPLFLTDGGDYKQQNIAKQLNKFIQGEFHQVNAYQHGVRCLLDSEILGDGLIKVLEKDNKVCWERRICTELIVDINDAFYGRPLQLYEFQLIDREVLKEISPKNISMIDKAESAYPETGGDSQVSTADLVMVVEAWRLPSSKTSNDGAHAIVCTEGPLFDEGWDKDHFPFAKLCNQERLVGYWGQGAAERLTGNQMSINRLLTTIDQSINIMGVPRVFVEEGSKIVKAHLNNQVGAIVTFRGQKPIYETAPCNAPEIYMEIEKEIQRAFQQEGVSQLSAASQKPAGLNSGEAIRNYDDLQTDRFASLVKKYEDMYISLAYLTYEKACEIAKREGSYQTIYPGKNGIQKIDLPEIEKDKDDFIIQCYDVSALPKDPSGRLQKITEMIQAGMIDIREGRRLLDFPDLEQNEKLANASEERILQILDKIVDSGDYQPADPFIDLQLANRLAVQYYNLYASAKLEEEKLSLIRKFITSVQTMINAGIPPIQPQAPAQPIGVPQARPVSQMMPMVPGEVS